jgi:hypothetical protein
MLHSLFISGNCSTCFGLYFHPSSGAHTTVSTASGICHTVTAPLSWKSWNRFECAVVGVRHPQHAQTNRNVNWCCVDVTERGRHVTGGSFSCYVQVYLFPSVMNGYDEKLRAQSRYLIAAFLIVSTHCTKAI